MEVGLIYKGQETGRTYKERTELVEITRDKGKDLLNNFESVKMPTMPNGLQFQFADLEEIYP